ncbi:hypothetical protein ACTA71_002066 [Dictyostelium dimigraforme]
MIINNYLIIFGYFISITFWLVSILIYILKIFNNDFGTFTSYGKLKFSSLNNKEKKKIKNRNDNNNNNNNNNNKTNFITSILNLFFLDREIIDTKQAWMFFYTVLLVLSNLFFFILSEKNDRNTTATQILFILFFIQAGRRLYETHFIQKHRKSEMNLLLFISGLCYYLFLTLSAFTETIYKINHSESEISSINIFNILLALLLFSVGSFEQFKSHEILSFIRSNSNKMTTTSSNSTTKNKNNNNILNNIIGFNIDDDDDNGDDGDIQEIMDKTEYRTSPSTKYEIPNGRLFQYVSSPHYLSEILIYFSYLILTNFELKSLILNFIFTSLNLIHRSLQTHKWYRSRSDSLNQSTNLLYSHLKEMKNGLFFKSTDFGQRQTIK